MGHDETWQWDVAGPSGGCDEAASYVHDVTEGGCTNAIGLEGRQWLWVGSQPMMGMTVVEGGRE